MKPSDYTQGLSHAELVRLLAYDSATGLFVWKINIGKAKKGAVAGQSHPNGYICIGVHDFRYLAHRLAWFYLHKVWPKAEIDHKNLDKADNRESNLREATKAQNMRNVRCYSTSASGFKGAKLDRRDGKYDASICVDGRSIYLGRFSTPEEANEAYATAAVNLHSAFARAA